MIVTLGQRGFWVEHKVDHGFICGYAVTFANIHDGQIIPRLLDPESEHDYVWADSAYSGERFVGLLKLGGFESLIHEKGARNHLSLLCPAIFTCNTNFLSPAPKLSQ